MDPAPNCSAVWTPSIIACIASKLSSNEASCLRVVNEAASEALSEHATIQLSQPVPVWAFKERWSQPGACRSLTRAQRRQLVSLTASSNIVPNLEVALAASGLPPCEEDLKAAAGSGALDSCRWLAEPGRLAGPVRWEEVMRAAARGGQEAACDLCLASDPSLRNDKTFASMAQAAALHGHVMLMDIMLAAAGEYAYRYSNEEESGRLFIAALDGCDLATVQRVCQQAGGRGVWQGYNWGELTQHSCPIVAALGSHAPDWQAKVTWLLTAEGHTPYANYCLAARRLPASAGAAALERVVWLASQPYCALLPEFSCWSFSPFVSSGHAEVLEWILASGVEKVCIRPPPSMLSSSGASAAREGHLAALQVLARSPWGSDVDMVAVVEAAAQAGRVEVLVWAWEAFRSDWDAACARTPGLLTWAARSGSVEAIRWVHSHGGGVVGQEAAWSGAVESGCQAAVEVLAELGGPMPSDGSPYARALELREWALLPLLHAQGVPMGGWAQERPLLARALEAGAAPASLLQGLAGEG